MFIPWYCKSIHVFTPLSYRLRAHIAVLPCKHFWLPASAMFFCSLRAVTHVPFPENTEKWAADHTHTACTSDPLYILSKVPLTEAAEGPLAENEGKRGERLRRQIEIRLGSVHSRKGGIQLKACHGCQCACGAAQKEETIWSQLHKESSIPFLHILKHDHSVSWENCWNSHKKKFYFPIFKMVHSMSAHFATYHANSARMWP